MKKILILALLCPVFFIEAQQLDESFLDSLPDDVREDLIERAENQGENADENYRASQFSSKLKQAEELIELKTRLEADLDELERRLESDEDISISEELKLYGSEFFNSFQTSFMPINEPNPDSSYTLDTGDVLNIQLIGQQDFIETFTIRGDGSINIPDIGN